MTAVALALVLAVTPDPAAVRAYDDARLSGNNTALFALGAWAAVNIVAGAAGWAIADDPHWQGVHQANLVWNLINMGFAIAGLVVGYRADAHKGTLDEALAEGRGTERIYWINAGLDVLYLAAAALLNRWGDLRGDPRMRGWAHASYVQAGFLLVFDTAMAVFHNRNNERALSLTSSSR